MSNSNTARIQVTSVPGEWQLVSLNAQEGLSLIPAYELSVLSETPDLTPDTLLGQSLVLALSGEDGGVRHIHGHITRFCHAGWKGRFAVYGASVRPWLWFLTLASHQRFFQSKTVVEVLDEVFADYPGTVDWQLTGSYPQMEYCVQYRETDFAFFSRLLEEAGLYYYFSHQADDHRLVIVDANTAHSLVEHCPQLDYRPGLEDTLTSVSAWESTGHLVTGKVHLGDFDFLKAHTREASVQGSEAAVPAGHGHGNYEMALYPGGFVDQREGDSAAKVWIEATQALRQQAQGTSASPYLIPGLCFELSNHPQDRQNERYLVVQATLTAVAEDSAHGMAAPRLSCHFVAIKSTQVFRAPLITPRPLIVGPQTAFVVGKAGEDVWVDQHGRIKVQFHWDRSDLANENCSCWVRVAQPIAGKRWGAMFLPRVGQEVIVEFLEGNPDRPLVTGSVYNAGMPPPWTLPAEVARSGLKSQSLGELDVYNELRFEDKAGTEQLLMHAGRNQDITVRNDAFTTVGNESHVSVGASQFVKVSEDLHESVDGNRNTRMGADYSLAVDGDSHHKTAGQFHASAAAIDFKGARTITVEAGTTLTLKAGSSTLVLGPSGVAINGTLITLDGSAEVDINSGSGGGDAASAQEAKPKAVTAPKEADSGRD